MQRTTNAVRAAGIWLALASLLMVVALLFHGPIASNLNAQMQSIAGGALRWTLVHWAAAAALSLFAVTSLIVLTAGSRFTHNFLTISAWAILLVGALWTVTTAVIEATVIAQAAADGDTETFKTWWSFSEGKATGFTFVALAIAVISANEVHSTERIVPVLSAWIGVVAGVASCAGWALGVWLGIGVGDVVWVLASIVMCLWSAWFGLAMARS